MTTTADNMEAIIGEARESAARAMYVTGWASAWEMAVEDGIASELPWSGGDDLMDVAPDEHSQMWDDAGTLLRTFFMDNRLDAAAFFDSIDPEQFGHYLAMQAMGHGVGLEEVAGLDSDALKVPYIEAHVDVAELTDAYNYHDSNPDMYVDEGLDDASKELDAIVKHFRAGRSAVTKSAKYLKGAKTKKEYQERWRQLHAIWQPLAAKADKIAGHGSECE